MDYEYGVEYISYLENIVKDPNDAYKLNLSSKEDAEEWIAHRSHKEGLVIIRRAISKWEVVE